MKFNLIQKYISVFCTLINTFLILQLYGLEVLGLYAFVTSAGALVSVFSQLSFRSLYLREVVKKGNDEAAIRALTLATELAPKISGSFLLLIPLVAIMLGVNSVETLSTSILIGIFLGSAQLTSAKLRAFREVALSQLVLNLRPLVMTGLIALGVVTNLNMKDSFQGVILISFAAPMVIFYLYWFLKYRTFITGSLSGADLKLIVFEMLKEVPSVGFIALGKTVISKSDSIMIAFFIGMEALGVYRLCSQLITFANSSLYPIRASLILRYSKSIVVGDPGDSERIEKKASKFGMMLYGLLIIPMLGAVLLIPYFEKFLADSDFLIVLAILGLLGFLKASVPMLDNYVIHRDSSSIGGKIMFVIIFANLSSHLILIPLMGISGACVTAVISFLIWRYCVRTYC